MQDDAADKSISYKEQRSVIRFLWAKTFSANPFSLRCTQHYVSRDYEYMFGVRNLVIIEKVLLRRNDLAAASIFYCITHSGTHQVTS